MKDSDVIMDSEEKRFKEFLEFRKSEKDFKEVLERNFKKLKKKSWFFKKKKGIRKEFQAGTQRRFWKRF